MMKKSILSLSAAVALGGLGFAGTANAVAFFGEGASGSDASMVSLNPGGVGHILITPYYTAQGDGATLFNITNTDNVNGKAVKVRFRSAANSDDVLDFTVFLSPGDVWTGSLRQRGDGLGQLKTADTSCTLPSAAKWPVNLDTRRLDKSLTDAQQAINANEGYIEVLTMADIPPKLGAMDPDTGKRDGDANPLYTNIKHNKNGVAPCDLDGFQDLLSLDVLEADEDGEGAQTLLDEYGLDSPTGGLMGTWAVYNQTNKAVFSGNMTAVVAHDDWSGDNWLTPLATTARVAFTPQAEANIDFNGLYDLDDLTADPLLRGADPYITALWFDLPDLSTPLTETTAIEQAEDLSRALSRTVLFNDYAANAAGAAVPENTDWVISQPTRRYHAAVDYNNGDSQIVWNVDMDDPDTGVTTVRSNIEDNIYSGLTLDKKGAYGAQACHMFDFSSTDREEKQVKVSLDGDFSPGDVVTYPYCGEVFTLSFNGNNSILGAVVTNRNINAVANEGWASLGVKQPKDDVLRLPILGFSGISQSNKTTNVHYGWTLPHRWDN